MPARALRASSPTYVVRAHVIGESAPKKCKMAEELPILKGILNGVVNYHNARRCFFNNFHDFLSIYHALNSQSKILSLTLLSSRSRRCHRRSRESKQISLVYFQTLIVSNSILSPVASYIFLTVLSRCRAADTRPTRAPGIILLHFTPLISFTFFYYSQY